MKRVSRLFTAVVAVGTAVAFTTSSAIAFDSSDPREILKSGLFGAGIGAISAEASGGKAGQGALIGAGTNILGSLLLGLLMGPSTSSYAQSHAAPAPQPAPIATQPTYTTTYYTQPQAQEDPNKKILRNGLLGAGVGALSAEGSGGKAGQGALIGAGTQVIGGALMDVLMAPAQSQPTYYASPAPVMTQPRYSPPVYASQSSAKDAYNTPKKHVIRKYDTSGNLVSEEEYWD